MLFGDVKKLPVVRGIDLLLNGYEARLERGEKLLPLESKVYTEVQSYAAAEKMLQNQTDVPEVQLGSIADQDA